MRQAERKLVGRVVAQHVEDETLLNRLLHRVRVKRRGRVVVRHGAAAVTRAAEQRQGAVLGRGRERDRCARGGDRLRALRPCVDRGAPDARGAAPPAALLRGRAGGRGSDRGAGRAVRRDRALRPAGRDRGQRDPQPSAGGPQRAMLRPYLFSASCQYSIYSSDECADKPFETAL